MVVDGVTVAPVNSSAILRVIDFSNPHLKGRPTLSTARADTLSLRNGTSVSGHWVSIDHRELYGERRSR